jgi:presequence protease
MSHPDFERLGCTALPWAGASAETYVHRRTGTRHYHLEAAGPGYAFLIAVPTPPEDDSGVPHVLEHLVLCASARHPAPDLFFRARARSASTTMNARAGPDWTSYHCTTPSLRDLDHLADLYLDAVFAPRLDPADLLQEAWRLDVVTRPDGRPRVVPRGVGPERR